MIRVHLLGPIDIAIDGSPPPAAVMWRKHLGLCLLLWVSEGRRVSRDTAIGMLWGDRPEREARHSLNEALRVIRRGFGADAVDSSTDLLRWVAPIEVDSDQLLSAVHTDPRHAAALIRGEWCEGFGVPDAAEFDRWLSDERRVQSHRLVAALVAAADRCNDAGEPGAALAYATRARRLDPLHEPAARAVILALALSGDRSGATKEADSFTALVRAEMGVDPDRELITLLRQLSGARPARPHVDPGSTDSTPLVGRDVVLRRALAALRSAREQARAALVLIDGDPGAGRTRLLEELAVRMELEGWAVLLVRALPADGDPAGAGLLTVAGAGLATRPGVAAISGAAMASLVRNSPAWAEQFNPDDTASQMALSDALLAAMRAAASEQPVLLAIDDVERFDPESQRWLPALLRGAAALPLAVALTTSRSAIAAEIDELRRQIDGSDCGALLRLEPLGTDDLRTAVSAALPHWPAAAHDRLARRLQAESAGLPAVAFAVLAAISLGLELEELRGAWPTPDRTFDTTLPSRLPDSFTAAVRLRFNALPAVARDLLTLMAMSRRPLDLGALAGLVGTTTAALTESLDLLEWQSWLVHDARGYRFRAAAVATLVAREMLTPGQRQRIRARLG